MEDAPRPIAVWLRSTRERQRMPNGAPWTQDYFLARMAEETGWVLARSNYSKYETGSQTPKPETLERFVTFWARYDEPRPDLNPVAPETTPDPLIAALDRQSTAMENLARVMAELAETQSLRLEKVEAVLASLVQRAIQDGDGLPSPHETGTSK